LAIDRAKYRRMFIEEAKEGLRTLDNDLVSLEKLEDDSASVEKKKQVMDAAFRTAHSLKGMGAAMGYTRFAELAHHLEDLADLARQGQAIGAEGFDLLLEGCDRLTAMTESVASGDEDPDAGDLPTRLQGFLGRTRGAQAPVTPTPAPPAVPGAAAPGAAALEGALLVVKVRIADDASLPQVRAFVVYKGLSALAGFKDSDPPPDVLRSKDLPQRTLTLRFETTASTADIERIARGAQGVAEVTITEASARPARPDESAAAEPERRERPAEEERTVRVRTALLDEFIDSVGELLLARSRMRALATKMDVPELFDLVDEVDRLTRELNARVVAARMTPLSFLADRLPRVVRDLARQQGKNVDFAMSGTDIELDRAILDELSAPFLHMMRNAVDHAHEGADARKAAGKAPAMKLALSASRDRDNVLLELSDDGKGIDPARLREKAIARGLISPSAAAALTDGQALELICMPGFSTAESVSQTSGRGVGMDVVKATLERLGGSLTIHAALGQGTRFVLTLPLTVAIIQVLVIEAGSTEDAYAIPVNRVERAVDLDSSAVSTARGKKWIRLGDELVPLTDLAEELGHAKTLGTSGTVIVVGRGADTIAVRVDRIVGQEEVVAKPLGAPLALLPFLSGAALLADGRAAFVLEPLRLARAEGPARAEERDVTRAPSRG
jgi:two-component system, chemotaxis family, sensor kinase CheA